MSHKSFYRAFEDKFRGSRALIKNRIKIYLPFILKLKELYPDSSALDIGCGRGEWLELLKDNGISAQGIDLDSGMLDACLELGLDVIQDNGIQYLKEQNDNSIAIVSAFHVVEHISFDDLQVLVEESLRVLKPGGILILETPNPENIKVATEKFYLDPTHIKSIPSELLSFISEFHGFIRTKVVKLNEPKELVNQNCASLMDVLGGTSPDYAVVAQKEADSDILKHFDNVFSQDFGISLVSLAAKFERRLLNVEAKTAETEAKANVAEAKANVAEAKANVAEAKANAAEAKANVAEAKANATEAKANAAEVEMSHILQSRSWRFTKPLRWFGLQVRLIGALGFRARFKSFLVKVIRFFISGAIRFVSTRPKLKAVIWSLIKRSSRLELFTRKFHLDNSSKHEICNATFLTERGKRILNDIKGEK
ncbi:class I SAM-dependent methyltransferase [Psychromonas aquimarina]|uniref:class I SAM-dependent methyltransferase n=1 Tax=Psychromonas aquimarina TaxID=444919 RepID=UPI000407C308|nr:class I SAM-dependent methyltransferase [Psychromonas aquimarina]